MGRQSDWSTDYISNVLELSRHTIEDGCSTASLNPDGVDQCNPESTQQAQGDQCVVACEAMRRKSSVEHGACDGLTDTPQLHSPYWAYQFPNFPSPLDQIEPYGIPPGYRAPDPVPKDAFVVNCAYPWHNYQRERCVQYLVEMTRPASQTPTQNLRL